MGYLLPRAIIVLIAWGMTCWLIKHLWPEADPKTFYVAAASWGGASVAYFAYLRRLRRESDLQRNRPYGARRRAT